MANKKHLSMLKKKGGVSAWNKWRSEHPEIIPHLREANLAEANLSDANLSGADLRKAVLSKAMLLNANLIAANLGGATLHGTDLLGANLRWAILIGANFREAHVTGVDLSNSTMWATSVADIDLSGVTGLEIVKHHRPSTIGIDTIYRSKGDIPDPFLRGAGVPDSFIKEMKSLVRTATAIEFYSCFISYSTKDKEFAERLYADLRREHVICWFAPHDMHSGRKLEEQIEVAIRSHERLLLILSLDSMKSEWVKTEIAKVRKREIHEKKRVLFPVRLVSFEAIRDWECFDADTGKDSAKEIREYFIQDFSNWEDSARYKLAFDRLLSDLKANDSARPGT